MSKQPSPKALSANSKARIDKLLSSGPSQLCNPSAPANGRPIYILSAEILHSLVVSSHYVQYGPTPKDPRFAFSWVDNRIYNDQSHETAMYDDDEDDGDDVDSRREHALAVLRSTSTVGRGRPKEKNSGPRGGVSGLVPRHFFERAHMDLEYVDFTKLDAQEKAYARAKGYSNLAKGLPTAGQQTVLLLDNNDRDNDVRRFIQQYFANQFTVTRRPSQGQMWPARHRMESWTSTSFVGDKLKNDKWEETIASTTGQPKEDLIIAVDTNAFFGRRDPKTGVVREQYLDQYLQYNRTKQQQQQGKENGLVTLRVPEAAVNEIATRFRQSRLPQPSHDWENVELAAPNFRRPSNVPQQWYTSPFGDQSIRLTLYGPSRLKKQILLVTGDNGMTTAAWHYDEPVLQVNENADDVRRWNQLRTQDEMSKQFPKMATALEGWKGHKKHEFKTATGSAQQAKLSTQPGAQNYAQLAAAAAAGPARPQAGPSTQGATAHPAAHHPAQTMASSQHPAAADSWPQLGSSTPPTRTAPHVPGSGAPSANQARLPTKPASQPVASYANAGRPSQSRGKPQSKSRGMPKQAQPQSRGMPGPQPRGMYPPGGQHRGLYDEAPTHDATGCTIWSWLCCGLPLLYSAIRNSTCCSVLTCSTCCTGSSGSGCCCFRPWCGLGGTGCCLPTCCIPTCCRSDKAIEMHRDQGHGRYPTPPPAYNYHTGAPMMNANPQPPPQYAYPNQYPHGGAGYAQQPGYPSYQNAGALGGRGYGGGHQQGYPQDARMYM